MSNLTLLAYIECDAKVISRILYLVLWRTEVSDPESPHGTPAWVANSLLGSTFQRLLADNSST